GVAASRLRDKAEAGLIAGPRVVVLGDRAELAPLTADRLRRHYGVDEVRRFELAGEADASGGLTAADRALAATAVEFARNHPIDEVVRASEWSDAAGRAELCAALRFLPIAVTLMPGQAMQEALARPVVRNGRIVALEVQRAPR